MQVLVYFWLVVKVSTFIYIRGGESFYIFAIILLVFGAITLGSNSPLEPKLISFFGIEEHIPSVFYITLGMGYLSGIIGILLVGQTFVGMLIYKIKKKSNDTERSTKTLA